MSSNYRGGPGHSASITQIGTAAVLRFQPGTTPEQRNALHEIVHSADTTGRYANTPNAYRDLTITYDPAAQAVIDSVKK
jgi:hypothetical protein